MIFVIRNREILKNLGNVLKDKLPVYTVKISDGETKSTAQRNYWHSLIEIISKELGEEKEDLKLRLKYEWLPLIEVKVQGKVYLHPIHTETLTKKHYSELIEKTLALGMNLGIKLPDSKYFGMEI